VNQQEVKALIADVKIKALDYQVILTSPSLGTGVDITFPDQEKLIDIVFGFFGPKVNTHFDCDQQLGRVRHPGEVKVWLTGARFHFETNREVIKQDIIRQSLTSRVTVWQHPSGSSNSGITATPFGSQPNGKWTPHTKTWEENRSSWRIRTADGRWVPSLRDLGADLTID
jgi:hypothetical protein